MIGDGEPIPHGADPRPHRQQPADAGLRCAIDRRRAVFRVDGNPNPVRWCLSAGIGGTGVLACRPKDTFGLGYFYIGLSNDFKNLLSGPVLGPLLAERDKQGVELFYNLALTPWCQVTPDLQIVQPSTTGSIPR